METLVRMEAAVVGGGDAVARHWSGMSRVDRLPPLGSWAGGIAPRLFTATLRVDVVDGEMVMFHASHAGSPDGVRAALVRRMHAGFAYAADVREGVDPGSPIARRLVGERILEALAATGDLCEFRRPLACGGALHVVEYASRGDAGGKPAAVSWRDGAFGRSS